MGHESCHPGLVIAGKTRNPWIPGQARDDSFFG
jgi:hypothetical protein